MKTKTNTHLTSHFLTLSRKLNDEKKYNLLLFKDSNEMCV